MAAVGSLSAAGVGTSGAEFLKVGVGSRALGMAGSAVTSVDDANAIYWNPARLAGLKGRSLTASYNSLFEDQSQGFLGAATPLPGGKSAVGFGLNYLMVDDIEKRTGDSEAPLSTFKNQNYAAYLSYAMTSQALDNVSWGASLKYIRQDLDTYNGSAVALDLGNAITLTDDLTLGFTMQNMGSKIGPDSLPLLFKSGVGYQMFHDRLTLGLDGDWWMHDKRGYVSTGGEFRVAQPLAVRAGYKFGQGQDHLDGATGLAVGLGLNFRMLNLDYAFVPMGDLGDTHRISFGVNF